MELQLDNIVKKYLKEKIHEIKLKKLKINPHIKFKSILKPGDKVEGRFVYNHIKCKFPGEIIKIFKSSIRIKTLRDNIPYTGENV